MVTFVTVYSFTATGAVEKAQIARRESSTVRGC